MNAKLRGRSLKWDDEDLDALSGITPEDIQDAILSAPEELRELLLAEPEPEVIE